MCCLLKKYLSNIESCRYCNPQAIPFICQQALPGFADRYQASSAFSQHVDVQLNRIYELVRPTQQQNLATKDVTVLCHRDLWFRNIMFTFDNDAPDVDANSASDRPLHAMLLDFQHCCRQPPAVDVLQLLQLCTRRAHRAEHLEAHLRWYWEHLSAEVAAAQHGAAEVPTWPAFRRSCDELRLFGLVFSGVYTPLMWLPDDELVAFRGERGRSVSRAEFVCDAMRGNRAYADVVAECCAELMEFVDGEWGAHGGISAAGCLNQ